jgi:hypothetical protein
VILGGGRRAEMRGRFEITVVGKMWDHSRASFAHRSYGAIMNGGVEVASCAKNCRLLVVRGKHNGRNLAELNMFLVWVDAGAVLKANALEFVVTDSRCAGIGRC